MKIIDTSLVAIGALACIALAGPATSNARAEDPDVVQEASGSDVTFYTGTTPSQPGRFEGKVVCLRSDRNFAPETASGCSEGSRVLALSMNGGDLVQTLLATTEDAHETLAGSVDQDIVVEGRHYASIGMILVTAVHDEGGGSELY